MTSDDFEIVEDKPWHPLPDDCPYRAFSPETLHAAGELARSRPPEPPEAIFVDKGDHVEVTVGDMVLKRPKGGTRVDLIIAHLCKTFGEKWLKEHQDSPPPDTHVVYKWWLSLCELRKTSAGQDHRPGEVFEVEPSGDAQEFVSLADAVYRLRVVGLLRPKLIDRLRHRNEFQGARYECGIAAAFVRCGFDVAWAAGSGRKCEFIATHRVTGESLNVEVKSRHRPGTFNEPGTLPDVDQMSLDVNRLLKSAREQCSDDKPCAIFIDVNLPPEVVGEPGSQDYWAQIKQLLANEPQPTAESPAIENCVVLTNYNWHYSGKKRARAHPFDFLFSTFAKNRLKNVTTTVDLIRAIHTFGYTPTGDEPI